MIFDGKDSKQYNHILKYIGLLGGIQGFTILLSVIRNKCAAILIGSVGIGTLDLYNRIVDFLSNSLNLGFPTSSIRKISQYYEAGREIQLEEEVKTVRMWCLWTSTLAFIITVIAAPFISWFTFGDFKSTIDFVFLAPITSLSIINANEIAILKGVREIKSIATISFITTVITTITTILFYYLWGMRGILPSLFLCCFVLCLLTLHKTKQLFKYHFIAFSRLYYRQGIPMVRMGLSFILAGMVGTGAEMLVRIFIINSSSIDTLGFYAAGFMLCVTYAKIIFVAMDADYYPRLSAKCKFVDDMCTTINRQIDVCVLLLTPLLIVFIMAMPLLIRILYTNEFSVIAPMTVCASYYMFFKAITAPIAYLPLAKGDSVMYLSMELLYDTIFVLLIIGGFHVYGLMGAGCALSLSNLFDMLLIYIVYKRHYEFHFDKKTWTNILIQGFLVCVTLISFFVCEGVPLLKNIIFSILLGVSIVWSVWILKFNH